MWDDEDDSGRPEGSNLLWKGDASNRRTKARGKQRRFMLFGLVSFARSAVADQHPTDMDHLALSKIGFVQLKTDQSSDGVNELLGKNLLNWIDQQRRHHRAVSRRPRRLQHHGKEFGIAGRTHALFINGRTAFVKSGRGFIIAADDVFAWWPNLSKVSASTNIACDKA